MDDIPLSALFTALGVLLLCSALFSVSETAMMAINRYRLRHLAQQGHRAARLTAQLLSRTDRLLGVILIGNNLVNIFATTLVTVITIRLFGSGELALSLATLALTFVVLVFCEITPKVIAATHPEAVAFPASYILAPLLRIAYPLVWAINLFVRALLWLLRVQPEAHGAHRLTLEELRTLVLEAGHFIPKKHQNILSNLFDLEKLTVDDVMTPRSQIEAIDLNASAESLRSQLATCYHTRIPAYRRQLDDIVGIVHVRKMLNRFRGLKFSGEELVEILEEPYFVPSGTLLLSQLQHFQENQRRLGLVVDEYGELMGLLTLEDILEEIVGEFVTHSPTEAGGFEVQEDGSVLVEGATTLRELNRKLDLELPLDGPRTLNGLILEHFQDIPEPGTTLKISDRPIEIVQTQDRAVKMVRIHPPVPRPEAEAALQR